MGSCSRGMTLGSDRQQAKLGPERVETREVHDKDYQAVKLVPRGFVQSSPQRFSKIHLNKTSTFILN